MTQDITAFGLKVRVIASNSFPAGFTVTQFADDGDPFDIPSIKIAETAMGLNGDLIVWAKANPITVTINVIPDSDDDKNLSVIFENNRVGKNKSSVKDSITLVGLYPSGKTVTMTAGKMTDGMAGSGVASAGRLKTKAYMFAFENKIST